MKKSELAKLRKLIKNEIKKREEIIELLENEYVKKFSESIDFDKEEYNPDDLRTIVKDIISGFAVVETNGIYVCIKAIDMDKDAYYVCVRPDSSYALKKIYKNIESRETKELQDYDLFERNNIVLNPYNKAYDDIAVRENGYDDARLDFFQECYKNSQYEAVQMILKKYPRIGTWK